MFRFPEAEAKDTRFHIKKALRVPSIVNEKKADIKPHNHEISELWKQRGNPGTSMQGLRTKDGIGNLNGKVGNQKTVEQCLQNSEEKLFVYKNSILSQTVDQT